MSGLVVVSGLFVVTDSPGGAEAVGGSGLDPGSGAGVRTVADEDGGGDNASAARAGGGEIWGGRRRFLS